MIRERLYRYKNEICQISSFIISDFLKLFHNNKMKIQNPVNKLYTLTYDGKNEAVHNKIIYFPQGLHGWKFWRCYTPFTLTNCKVENPSIAVSNDGYKWTLPKGLNNPIESLSDNTTGFNSDPHLIYNPKTCLFECWFRYCKHKGGEYIYRKLSPDGINWSAKELMQSSNNTYQSLVCPVIIFEKNKYLIWILTNDDDQFTKGSYIKYYESIDGKNWSYIRDIHVYIEPDHMPWHFDIEKKNDTYHMVYSTRSISNYNDLRYIAYAYSNNNINYKSSIILSKSKKWYRWDNYKMHRPSIAFVNGKCLLYYSAQNKYFHWGTGVLDISTIIKI